MNIINPHMLPKVRSEDLRRSATLMPCTLRIGTFIGWRCAETTTNVMAHMPVHGKGTSTKVSDLHMVCACVTCHDLLDQRDRRGAFIRDQYTAAYYERLFLAHAETLSRWVDLGLITGTDWEII